jgi:hypothetical protein
MKKSVLIYILLGSFLACCTTKTGQNTDPLSLLAELDKNTPVNQLAPKEKKLGWKLMSDGKSFINWHGFNMDGVPDCWIIEEGAFKVLTQGGEESDKGLVTDKVYKSFALSLEFKVDKGANSGILFQVAEDPKYTYAYETGPEYQVIDHEGWPGSGLTKYQICGANYAMYAPKAEPFKPAGEWNQVLLVVDGNKVTQILNGEIVVEYEKYSEEWTNLRNSGKWSNFPDYGKFDEGHIALQNHSTTVWYRDIKLKEL